LKIDIEELHKNTKTVSWEQMGMGAIALHFLARMRLGAANL
jgi:hypothetical protein